MAPTIGYMKRVRILPVLFVLIWQLPLVSQQNASPKNGLDFIEPGLKHLAEVYRPGFMIGTHTKDVQVDGSPGSVKPAEIISREYNLISVGIYQKRTQRSSRDDWDFSTVDPIINFAQQHGLTVYAHPMFGSNNYVPDWLVKGDYTDEELLRIIEERIRTILTRYRGKIDILDVYNEGFYGHKEGWREEDNLFLRFGYHENEYGKWPVALEKMLIWCRKYGGDELKLVYNDNNNAHVGSPQSNDCYNLFRALRKAGIPIDGIGIQLHTKVSEDNVHYLRASPGLKQNPFDPELFAQGIRKFGEAGAAVYISECDVHLYGEVDSRKLAVQAEAFRNMLRVCISEPACRGFKTWGFTDASCWKPLTKNNPGHDYEPYPLVFDHDLQPKPAYFAMKQLLVDLIRE